MIAQDWSSYWKVYRKLNSFKASQIASGSCCIFEPGGRHQPDSACRSVSTYACQVWSRRYGCQPGWIAAGWSPDQGGAVTDARCSSVCCPALPWVCKSCSWYLTAHRVVPLASPCCFPYAAVGLRLKMEITQHSIFLLPAQVCGEEWLHTGTICFFHWEWFIGRNC